MSTASYLLQLRDKARYSGYARLFFDALRRVGIVIGPYYLVREDIHDCTSNKEESLEENYQFLLLDESHCDKLAGARTHYYNSQQLKQRFKEGDFCLALLIDEEVASYSWYSLTKFRGKELASNEAYLYDAYTNPEHRGLGLVPIVRRQVYRVTRANNKSRLLSLSEYFNKSSLRFKEKLGSEFVHFGINVSLFRLLNFTVTLKTYD